MLSSTNGPGNLLREIWVTIAHYCVPPAAAAAAIVPVFRDMALKSAQQRGHPVPYMTFLKGVKEGLKASPTVGIIVGTQMVAQNGLVTLLAKAFTDRKTSGNNLSLELMSSGLVGLVSAPALAIFNGQTMGWSVRESLHRFSVMQGLAIAMQEAAFVGGVSASDYLAVSMKKRFGNNKIVDYAAAFFAGAAGSLAGHPANTALTRWQSGMTIKGHQLMLGSLRRTWAVACFSVLYKFWKEVASPTARPFST